MTSTEKAEKIFQQNTKDHPHLLKVYRDKIGKFRYLKAIVTGGNFQVDQTFMIENREKIELPGDWVVTIKENLVIVTCDGFMFSRRTPVVVKPWKKVGDTADFSMSGSVVLFEDCDGLCWSIYAPRENTTDEETRKSLTAVDQEGEECLIFYLED